MNTTIFITAFIIYIVAMAILGWYVTRKKNTTGEDFLLGGRRLPFFLILGSTVATMVGTGSSMGAVGFGYLNGWGGALYGLGGASGLLLLGLLFSNIRKYNFMTMSEELSFYYGANKYVKNIVSILIFIASIGWLGAHMLGGGLYLSWIAEIDLTTSKILIALGFSVYVIVGGYAAVVWTDTIQAIVLFFVFILMAVLALIKVGGLTGLHATLDAGHASFLGIGTLGIIPAFSLALVIAVGVLATPSHRQRIYATDSVRNIKKSCYIGGGLYLLFSFVPAIIGMCAYILNPTLENSNFAFPYLAVQILPLGIGVIMLIAGLSATMSSASSDAIAAISILLRDVYMIFTGGKMPPKNKMVLYSRIGLVLIIGIALIFAILSSDIIGYITKMIATIMSGMFVCAMMGKFWKRAT